VKGSKPASGERSRVRVDFSLKNGDGSMGNSAWGSKLMKNLSWNKSILVYNF
jgi:hypothetical protein